MIQNGERSKTAEAIELRDAKPARDALATGAPEPSSREREAPARKERVLHTRVPAVLEQELKRFAENLRIPLSNLVRTILEDAVNVADAASESVEARLKSAATQLEHERERLRKRVQMDPLTNIFAFQTVTLAQPTMCAKCGASLSPGDRAHLGLADGPRHASSRLFVCDACLPKR